MGRVTLSQSILFISFIYQTILLLLAALINWALKSKPLKADLISKNISQKKLVIDTIDSDPEVSSEITNKNKLEILSEILFINIYHFTPAFSPIKISYFLKYRNFIPRSCSQKLFCTLQGSDKESLDSLFFPKFKLKYYILLLISLLIFILGIVCIVKSHAIPTMLAKTIFYLTYNQVISFVFGTILSFIGEMFFILILFDFFNTRHAHKTFEKIKKIPNNTSYQK